MKPIKFEQVKQNLRDSLDIKENIMRREVSNQEAEFKGYRNGVWDAIRAFEEANGNETN